MENLSIENETVKRILKEKEELAKELNLAKKHDVKSDLMKTQIRTSQENGYTYREEDRKFGLIRENRPINANEVHKFTQKIQNNKYETDLQPIVVVEAKEMYEKYNITDLEGNTIQESELNEYLIVLDGQHRICAFSKLNSVRMSDEDKILIPDVLIKTGISDIREYLANMNTVGHDWDTSDKMCVAAISSENPTLLKIYELIKKGFNASAAITMCTGGKRLTAKQMNDILSGDTSCLPTGYTESLRIAEKFVVEGLAIDKMSPKMLSKRYFVKGFLSFIKFTPEKEAFSALKNLTIKDFKDVDDDLMFLDKLKTAA